MDVSVMVGVVGAWLLVRPESVRTFASTLHRAIFREDRTVPEAGIMRVWGALLVLLALVLWRG